MKYAVVFLLGVMCGLAPWIFSTVGIPTSPLESVKEIVELPYEKYTFERLAERTFTRQTIEYGRIIEDSELYTSQMFYYTSEGRRISGLMYSPKSPPHGPKGTIIMARGYVEKEGYKTGTGTKNAAAYYATHGYQTYAPDFSGYGESDPEDPNPFGARLVKPIEILDLIASMSTHRPIYLWGHSNGGQIMLSVAEILGRNPVVTGEESVWGVEGLTLWAPVSKPFPYNILYYSDEADDKGRWLRGEIAKFETFYDVNKYSIDKYWDTIKIPILIHQGTLDQEVPWWWSVELHQELESAGVTATHHTYPGADHNLKRGWDSVVARDIQFFQNPE